jgi:hypothetical protein
MMADFEITDATERNLARFGGHKRRYERAAKRARILTRRSEEARKAAGFDSFWNDRLYRWHEAADRLWEARDLDSLWGSQGGWE